MPKSWHIGKWVPSLFIHSLQWIKPRLLQRDTGSGCYSCPNCLQWEEEGQIDDHLLKNLIVSPLLSDTSSWVDSVIWVLSSPGLLRGSWGTLHAAAASAHTFTYGQGISPCPRLPWFSLNPNILIWMCCLLWYSTWILQKQPQSSWQKGHGSLSQEMKDKRMDKGWVVGGLTG